jgi:hypothetical protein
MRAITLDSSHCSIVDSLQEGRSILLHNTLSRLSLVDILNDHNSVYFTPDSLYESSVLTNSHPGAARRFVYKTKTGLRIVSMDDVRKAQEGVAFSPILPGTSGHADCVSFDTSQARNDYLGLFSSSKQIGVGYYVYIFDDKGLVVDSVKLPAQCKSPNAVAFCPLRDDKQTFAVCGDECLSFYTKNGWLHEKLESTPVRLFHAYDLDLLCVQFHHQIDVYKEAKKLGSVFGFDGEVVRIRQAHGTRCVSVITRNTRGYMTYIIRFD